MKTPIKPFPKIIVSALPALCLLLPALAPAETAVEAWVQRLCILSSDAAAEAVAVDSGDNVIVTGTSDWPLGEDDFTTIKYSKAGVPLWTNRYDGPLHQTDEACAVAVDRSDSVIVTGWSSGGSADFATVKYSSAGVPLWTNRFDDANSFDAAVAVAVDGNGCVLVTGYSWGMDAVEDFVTIKYSGDGVPLWTNRYDGPANSVDLVRALAVDGNNDVIVTGTCTGTGSCDYATLKYSSAGVPLWTNLFNGPENGDDMAHSLAVDHGNNVVVTGSAHFRGVGSSGTNHFQTVKYSSAGAPLWTNYHSGNTPVAGNGAQALAVDRDNNVIVTGSSAAGTNSDDFTTIKYSAAGAPLWTNLYNGPWNNTDRACAVKVDAGNNVIVAGSSYGEDQTWDYATIKYTAAGVPLWTNRFTGAGYNDLATGLAVDGADNIIVTGFLETSMGTEFATVKYIFASQPVITTCQLTGGQFQCRVAQLVPPATVVIEAATNLPGWTPVFTNTTLTNHLIYADPVTGQHAQRFYRAAVQP